MSDTLQLQVAGMTCGGCENAVKRTLLKLNGVDAVEASHVQQSVRVDFRPELVTRSQIESAIHTLGYEVRG